MPIYVTYEAMRGLSLYKVFLLASLVVQVQMMRVNNQLSEIKSYLLACFYVMIYVLD